MMNLLKRYPITTFFLLAFTFAWAIRIPMTILQIDITPLKLVAEFAPTFAALIVTLALSGKSGVRALLARVGKWRVGLQWYALVLIEPVAVQLLGIGVYVLLGGRVQFHSPGFALPILILVGLILSLGEEIGWRGFALPHLQSRSSMVVASLVIGILWAFWHVPADITSLTLLILPSTYLAFLWFVAFTCAGSLLMSWVYNRTAGSVFLMILLHVSLSILGQFVSAPSWQPGQAGPNELATIMQWIIVLVAALVLRARKRPQQAVA